MQTLMKLDTIKARMKAASEALQEADNWTTLSANVEEVLDSGDIDAITAKLVGMQQSLHILTDVPDYVERCQYLETLKNRLEAILSPHVVAAFSSQSLEAAQKFSSVFAKIERSPQLCKYYHKCHKGQLEQAWQNIVKERPKSCLTEWMSELYDQLLCMWQVQMKWCGQVFAEPVSIVCDLMSDSLASIHANWLSYIDSYISSSNQSPLTSLIALRQITDSFASQLEAMIESPALGTALYTPYVERLAQTIYAPFRTYVSRFGQYEGATLSAALESIQMDHTDVVECVALLHDSVSKLFSAANASNQRCIEFTSGCGYIILPQTLQEYLRHYIEQFERAIINVREKCKVDSATVDMDEWSSFQNSLRIIQTCGDLILHVDELDQLLVTSIISTVGKYVHYSSPSHREVSLRSELRLNPFHNHKMLLLSNSDERLRLELLMKHLEDGDNPTVLEAVKQDVFNLSSHVHKFAFDIVFAPLRLHLTDVPNMTVWKSENAGMALTSNLPDFSLSPQEYITQIGQYLMTLPQQLEPFTMSDTPMLTVALRHGKLPYVGELSEMPEHMSSLWLESVARGTMHIYTEQILKIRELTEQSTKQLITDIDYLSNVLDDLGLEPSETIKTLVSLLQASHEQYSELAEKAPQRLASAIATIRCLKLD
jgi:hypothetical protein